MTSTVKFQCVDNQTPIFLIDSVSGIYNTNTKDSTNSSTGSVLLYGGLSINTTTNSSSKTNGGAFTVAGGASIEKDVYIGGNLTVLGTQTQIVSQTIKVGDNLIVLNASPISGRDAGILFERYQTENDSNIGDIISDAPFLIGTVTSSTADTVTLDNTAETIDNYYNNFFIKINNQVRKINSYTGTLKTAHLNTSFTTIPNNGDTFTLYNKVYASQYYKEDTNNFVFSYTEVDPGSSNVKRGDLIGLETGYISIFDTKDTVSSSNSIGSFVTLGGASIAKSMYVGNTIYSNSINTTNGSFLNVTTSNILSTNSTITNSIITNSIITNTTTSNLRINDWIINISSGNLIFNHKDLYDILNISSSGNVSISNRLIANNINTTTNITVGGNIIGNGNMNLNGNVYLQSTIHTIGNVYTNGQNVGINVISPSYHLDVAGNAHVSGNLFIDGVITSSALDSTSFAYLTLTAIDDAINYSTGSLITFGGITSSSETDAESVSNGGTILTKGGASIGKRLFVGKGVHAIFNSNTIGSLYTTGGNIGINTTSPQNTLDVNGGIKSNSINSLTISTANLSVLNATSSSLFTTNVLSTNITTNNVTINGDVSDSRLQFKDTTDWSLVSSTSGPFSIRYNNSSFITINTNGNSIFSNDSSILNTNPTTISGGSLNISGDIVVSGTKNISFTQTGSGLGSPSTSTRSSGTKIVLRPEIGGSTVDYAIGVETNNLWFSSNSGIKWYKGTDVSMNLESSGSLQITGTTNASGLGTGGSLTLGGGCSVGKDLYIGGNLYVNGQNTSSISGLTAVGSFSGTSVYSIIVTIGTTMQNTTYKVIGNLSTTTSNTNTYIVSFSNITTTTFTANILRLDSLFSGWTDSNLNLSWTIFP